MVARILFLTISISYTEDVKPLPIFIFIFFGLQPTYAQETFGAQPASTAQKNKFLIEEAARLNWALRFGTLDQIRKTSRQLKMDIVSLELEGFFVKKPKYLSSIRALVKKSNVRIASGERAIAAERERKRNLLSAGGKLIDDQMKELEYACRSLYFVSKALEKCESPIKKDVNLLIPIHRCESFSDLDVNTTVKMTPGGLSQSITLPPQPSGDQSISFELAEHKLDFATDPSGAAAYNSDLDNAVKILRENKSGHCQLQHKRLIDHTGSNGGSTIQSDAAQ